MTPPPASAPVGTSRRVALAWRAALVVAAAIAVPFESLRCAGLWERTGSLTSLLFHWNIDATPYALLLAVLPLVAWRVGQPAREEKTLRLTAGRASLVAAALSLAMSLWVSRTLGDLPPAFHDEYSYLFQARTFLAGETSFPSAAEPALFDQMHVLNEGRFASRYFPGVGLWLMPWVAIGRPLWGQWAAGMIAAALSVQIGASIATVRAGLIAGLLVALSPGLALFSNLLLSHHPTLVGLLLFLWAFLRMRSSPHVLWPLLSGSGLAFAMLCRPMTAAGAALPFGLWIFLRGEGRGEREAEARPSPLHPSPLSPLASSLLLATPVLAGLLGLGWYNAQITGSPWVSPYQQYTEIYTPRHVYGFDNVIRGERNLGPKVLENYDRWAENLTPALALTNVRDRVVASGQWTLGLVPLAMVLVLAFSLSGRTARCVVAILASIVSLHLVHVPYWYVGIMHWHYVFESAPLWLIVTGVVTDRLFRHWTQTGRRSLSAWWSLVLMAPVAVNMCSFEPAWTGRLWQGVAEVRFPRQRQAQFRAGIERFVRHQPAIVLVKPDPADRHIDLVVNDPDLESPVLIGRWLEAVPPSRVQILYPNRAIYRYDAARGQWELLSLPRRNP